MKIKQASSVFLLLLSITAALGQGKRTDLSQPAVFASFRASLNRLEDIYLRFVNTERIEAEIATQLVTIKDNVKFLEAATKEREAPKEYVDSLGLDAELLSKLLATPAKSNRAKRQLLKGLNEVASDLAVKVSDIADTRGNNDGRPRNIRINVHARKDGQEVNGYEVWYVAKAWEGTKEKWNRFDRLTNAADPAAADLPPGRYVMWLSLAGTSTPRQIIKVGVEDALPKNVDLVIP